MPNEIWEKIFQATNPQDEFNLALTCKGFYQIGKRNMKDTMFTFNDMVWKRCWYGLDRKLKRSVEFHRNAAGTKRVDFDYVNEIEKEWNIDSQPTLYKTKNSCIQSWYYSTGTIWKVHYFKHRKVHRSRDEGPAIIHYFANGKVQGEMWVENGVTLKRRGTTNFTINGDRSGDQLASILIQPEYCVE